MTPRACMEIQICFRGNAKPFTPIGPRSITCKWIRQNSGLDHYAHVEILIEPIDQPMTPCRYLWEASEAEVPSDYFDFILEGIKRAVESDESPYDSIESARIRVVGGSFNEIDSKGKDFMFACYIGVMDYLVASMRTVG